MSDFTNREYFPPVPRPFVMNAMQFFSEDDLNPVQRKKIATLFLDYFKKCAEAEVSLAEGMINEVNNLENKR